jgi:hypothetical protein
MNLIFDICSTHETLSKFCDQYDLNIHDDYGTIFKSFFHNCSECPNDTYLEFIKSFPKINEYYHRPSFEQTEYVSMDELKIGHEVYVQYMPMSQKYIDYYDEQNVCGKVIFIDVENDDALLIFDSGGEHVTRRIMSINRDYCSYYGDSRGYSISIYLQD